MGNYRTGSLRCLPAEKISIGGSHDRRRSGRTLCRADPHPPICHRLLRITGGPAVSGDDTTKFFVNIIIAILISVVSTAVITLLLSFKFEKEECSDRDVIGKQKKMQRKI